MTDVTLSATTLGLSTWIPWSRSTATWPVASASRGRFPAPAPPGPI